MTFLKWFFATALVCTAGCGSLRPGEKIGPGGAQLKKNQERLVEALAHYGAALLHEESSASDTSKALWHLEAAIEKDPGTLGLYTHAAGLCMRNNQREKALDILEEAVRQNPSDPEPRISLALIYLGNGKHNKATGQYKAAIDLAPGKWELYRQLAAIHVINNNDKEALKTLQTAMNNLPDKEPALSYCYNIALRHIQAKQVRQAIPFFELMAEHAGERKARFQEILGELYVSTGNFDKAADLLRKSAAANPDDPGLAIKLAAVYSAQDYKKSIRFLESTAKKFKDNFPILYRLAMLYSIEKMNIKSIETFEKALRAWEESDNIEPPPMEFYLRYGAIMDKTGKPEQAIAIVKECLRKYPGSHQAKNFIAYTWAENNTNLDKALVYVREALEAEPENGAYIDTLGWIYYKQGRFEKARDEIKTALELMGEDPVLLDHLGDIYRKLGKTQKALSNWEKSFILDPENKTTLEKLRDYGANTDELKKKAEEEKQTDR